MLQSLNEMFTINKISNFGWILNSSAEIFLQPHSPPTEDYGKTLMRYIYRTK